MALFSSETDVSRERLTKSDVFLIQYKPLNVLIFCLRGKDIPIYHWANADHSQIVPRAIRNSSLQWVCVAVVYAARTHPFSGLVRLASTYRISTSQMQTLLIQPKCSHRSAYSYLGQVRATLRPCWATLTSNPPTASKIRDDHPSVL